MATLGVTIAQLAPGEIELAMPFSASFTQQNGYLHAGIIATALDSACGYAAYTLMPAAADILTVEFKINLLSPAKGDRFHFCAHVVKAGRKVTVADARAYASEGESKKLIATMTGTLIALQDRR
jgi:uncharacterized protein (TIGR00369 family)